MMVSGSGLGYSLGVFVSILTLSVCDVDMDSVVHFRTLHGDTLLHAAVRSRNHVALASFIELGCPLEEIDKEGRTPLWLAVELGEVTPVDVLAKYGADFTVRYSRFNESLLHTAAKHGRDLVLYNLLEDHGFSTEGRDRSGWTPLHHATAYNHPTTARLLLARGADVNAGDTNGETPLHKAAWLGKRELASILLEHGASPSAEDFQGRTPVDMAKEMKHKRIVRMLAEYEARNSGLGGEAEQEGGRTQPEISFEINSLFPDFNQTSVPSVEAYGGYN